MMSIHDAEKIIQETFPNNSVRVIDDMENYFVFELAAQEGAMDMVHMIDKQTGNVIPYNPTLLKGKPEQ